MIKLKHELEVLCKVSIENPNTDKIEIFHKLRVEQFIEVLSYVLEFYGGRFSIFFILKCWNIIKNMNKNEFVLIVTKMNYNRAFGVDNLFEFLLIFTGLKHEDIIWFSITLETKNISIEIDNRFHHSNRLLNDKRNLSYCEFIGYDKIEELNNWTWK